MLLLGATSYFTALPKYRDEAKIALPEEKNNINNVKHHQIMIKSDSIVINLAHRLGRIDTTQTTDEKRVQAINQLRPLLKIRQNGHTRILTLEIIQSNPEQAQKTVNVWSEIYQSHNPEIAIVQQALLPQKPINPSTPISIAITGGILGFVTGLICALIAEGFKPHSTS